MRFLTFTLFAVELLQTALIAGLFIAYRNLHRKVNGNFDWRNGPPRSVTEE